MIKIDYSKIKVGDAVYIASDDRRGTPYVAVVTKIGRKYITATQRPDCEWDKGIQFSNENGFMKEWGQYRLYPSKDFYVKLSEYEDKVVMVNRKISFAMDKMSFDEIDQIYNLVKKYTK